ncbi:MULTISPECIES: hypothetical protein [unclassified Novosphingobium]|uniref:hypothetical protein n=1 Tax=unclassified Novosphingobium TaxID=2644732 RepID=UPI00146CC1E6|nr:MULTISPECIES: hypothetical protein [unclassified Novosphingobium]NMN06840.1 TolB-like protein [Novosphingobium sp. SG919]NMN88710.1 TolB-like protein [Novosphingobium sp. SG916]
MSEKYKSLIKGHLHDLRTSAAFAKSNGLYLLLEYVVNETLSGRGDTLKELVIGDALYGRSSPYDPKIDSAVRVEARRLRRKLNEHYQGPGKRDAVRVTLPTGGYVPSFEILSAFARPEAANEVDEVVKGRTVDLAVMPFRALSGCERQDRFADGLTDQLIFALSKRSRLKLAPRMMVFQYKDRPYTVPEAVRDMGARAMLYGTCRSVGDRTRVTVETCDEQGFVTWSTQIDQVTSDDLALQDILSGAIISRMPSWLLGTIIRDRPLVAVVS